MKATGAPLFLLYLLMSMSFGQSVVSRPRFEVVSVKIAPPSGRTGGPYLLHGGPGTRQPQQITFTPITVKALILLAYDVPSSRIAGPAWLDTELYNVVAKLPAGTTKDQYKLMLQDLLEDRFGLKLHHETRGLPGYELTVAKRGLKMQRAVNKIDGYASSGSLPGDTLLAMQDKNGLPQLRPGRKGRAKIPLPSGLTRMSGRMQSLADVAEMCQTELNGPVADRTGLAGAYDFNLDFVRLLMSQPSVTATGQEEKLPADPLTFRDMQGPDFLAALQEQLGLKLEKKNIPIDVLVIDRVNKVPTGN